MTAAARSLGYQPDPIARSLRTNRTMTVGLLIPDLTDPLFPPLVRGIQDAFSQESYTVLLDNSDNDPERELAQLELFRARKVEGVLIAPGRLDHPATLRAAEYSMPVVLLHCLVEHAVVHAVVADNAAGTRMAVDHLLSLGHRRIAYIAGPLEASTAIERLSGYREAMRTQRLLDESLIAVCPSWSPEAGEAALRALLDGPGAFTGVAAASDLLAIGCYGVMAERGLSCPSQLSVVGFDDMAFVDRLSPPLSTARVPHYRMGVEASKMLLAQLQNRDDPPKIVTVPVEFVPRGSSGPAPA